MGEKEPMEVTSLGNLYWLARNTKASYLCASPWSILNIFPFLPGGGVLGSVAAGVCVLQQPEDESGFNV